MKDAFYRGEDEIFGAPSSDDGDTLSNYKLF